MPVETKALINYINNLQKGAKNNPALDAELLPFIKNLYSQLSGKMDLPVNLNPNNPVFSSYCYNLMVYRACTADLNLNRSKKNYLDYLKENNIFSRSLSAGNPFVLKRHLDELMKLVDATKSNPLSAEEFVELSDSIKKLADAIETLPPTHCAQFKAMMMGYSDVLQAKLLDYNLPDAKKEPVLIAKLYDTAKQSFQLAEELQKPDDISLNLYADPGILPRLPFKDALAEVARLESAAKNEIDEDDELAFSQQFGCSMM